MGRNLSPVLYRELANLDKGDDSRKLAMKALKSYVKDLDSKALPLFLAKVSETKDAGSSYGEFTISLYEVLAKVHGPNIVSQIDIIMGTIIRTLTTSGGSFPLQQACSKVAPAIARYGIEPTTPEDKKKLIIRLLCKPLSDSLLGTQESLSSGAALCLKALVDCDNWRFASNEMVNEVCLKLAGALKDKITQTNSHMGLVMSLAKRNSLIVEAYAGILIDAALEILNSATVERNSQRRFEAIQMINFLMKSLDIGSIFSELEMIIEEMKKCESDQMQYVKGAAFEALQTAKRLMSEKVSKFDSDVISETGSNFRRSSKSRDRYRSISGDRSPSSASPESQTLDSFADYESFVESPISGNQSTCKADQIRKNCGRKLWNHENQVVNVSLKDGIFSEIKSRSGASHGLSEHCEGPDSLTGYSNGFSGFVVSNPAKKGLRSQTPSPQRTRSQINPENIKICSTPRKLVRSLQDQNDENLDFYMRQLRSLRSPFVKCTCIPSNKYNQNNGLSNEVIHNSSNGNVKDEGGHSQTESESVSSTDDVPIKAEAVQISDSVLLGNRKEQKKPVKNIGLKSAMNLFFAVSVMLTALFTSILLFSAEDQGRHLVPT